MLVNFQCEIDLLELDAYSSNQFLLNEEKLERLIRDLYTPQQLGEIITKELEEEVRKNEYESLFFID